MQEARREKLNPCQLEVVRMTRQAKIIQRPKAVQTNGISYTTIERGGRREMSGSQRGASYLTATSIFADGGIMHSSPGL